jgi:hypothetical protein
MKFFRAKKILKNQKGQSIVEYVLVMAIVVTAIIFVLGKMKKSEFFFKRFTEPLVKHLAYNYKYAEPSAQGWDEGTPNAHIQIQEPQGRTFRLFQPGQ